MKYGFSILLITLCFNLTAFARKKSNNIDMFPPGVKALLKKQAERLPRLLQFKINGYIGEADSGFMKIRTTKGLSLKQKKVLVQLATNENKDRKMMYLKIRKKNALNKKQYSELLSNFYKVSRDSSAKTTYYYENKAWHQKQE